MFVFRESGAFRLSAPAYEWPTRLNRFNAGVYRTKSGGLIPGGLRLAPEAVNSRATVNGTGRVTDRSHHR
jgi:hypothetical protein